MDRYLDVDGDSGVAGYLLGNGWIVVEFRDGAQYEYTSASAGAQAIAEMHALAKSGDGLNSFINRRVKKAYARKLR